MTDEKTSPSPERQTGVQAHSPVASDLIDRLGQEARARMMHNTAPCTDRSHDGESMQVNVTSDKGQ